MKGSDKNLSWSQEPGDIQKAEGKFQPPNGPNR